jgi:hypothetical protein
MRRVILLAVLLFVPSRLRAEDSSAIPLPGEYPKPASEKLGSGSGILIGKHEVLTNRHVAVGDDGKPYGGFRIALGPDFDVKQAVRAKAVYVSRDYDLAVLETESAMDYQKLWLLDDVPPLGTKVTAFGFPLGSQMGIGITLTGGQISRLPVKTDGTESQEQKKIRLSMWHDAVIAHGSSGGPLYSEKGVLVGLNWGELTESAHYLAVPGKAVGTFLRDAKLTSSLELIANEALAHVRNHKDSQHNVVFIEICDSAPNGARRKSSTAPSATVAEVHRLVISDINTKLKAAKSQQLLAALKGSLLEVYPVTSPKQMHPGDVVRIQGAMTVLSIIDEGVLALIHGVQCFIVTDKDYGAELRAKYGAESLEKVPVDFVCLCGKAEHYQTIRDTRGTFLPVVRIGDIVTKDEIIEAVKAERERRNSEQLSKERGTAQKMAETLTHWFADKTGTFSAQAVFLGLEDGKACLLRTDNKKELKIDPAVLKPEDQAWLRENASAAANYGNRIRKLYANGEKDNAEKSPEKPVDKK